MGPDVKYTADPQDNGLYICLDPFEGKYFVSELKVKIGTAEEKSLVVGGMYIKLSAQCIQQIPINLTHIKTPIFIIL